MIDSVSRNQLTAVVTIVDPVTGEPIAPSYLDLRPRVTDFDPGDRFITVDQASTWANIALANLGDARHWWAIADLSNVVDPFEELTEGVTLRVPSHGRMIFSILEKS